MNEEIKPDINGDCTREKCFYFCNGPHCRCTIKDNYKDVQFKCPAWLRAQLTELAELREFKARVEDIQARAHYRGDQYAYDLTRTILEEESEGEE